MQNAVCQCCTVVLVLHFRDSLLNLFEDQNIIINVLKFKYSCKIPNVFMIYVFVSSLLLVINKH